ncbi:hypothetical protein P4V64_26080 [Bacillus thuringiensis]|nr:hypothetical protein [Bacillus thuringiensis]
MKNRISIDPNAPDSLLAGAKKINANFDQIDTSITHIHLRAGINQKNILEIALELETLKGAILNGVTRNIYIESFIDLEDVNLLNVATKHDSVNKKVYLA